MMTPVSPVNAAAIASAVAVAVANIDAPTELGSLAGAVDGEFRLAYQAVAGANEWTLYAWDSASSTGASSPYRVNGSSGQWIAVAGKYVATSTTALGSVTALAAATQDALRISGRAGGTGSYVATMTPPALSASITLTTPASTTTLAGLSVAQTWTALQTHTSGVAVGGDAVAADTYLRINTAAGQFRGMLYQSGGASRWLFAANADPESGSNAGSDFELRAYADNGDYLGNALSVVRSTRAVTIPTGLTVSSGTTAVQALTATTLTVTGASGLAAVVSSGSTAGDYIYKIDNTSATGLGLRVQAGADGNNALAVRNTAGSSITFAVTGGGDVSVAATTASTSTTTGALVVTGGVGIGGSINAAGGAIRAADARFDLVGTKSGGNNWFFQTVDSDGRLRIYDQTNNAERVTVSLTTGAVSVLSTTASTSTATGALVVSGGVGVAGNLNVGGTLTSSGTFILSSSAPASASATGTAGTITWDSSYLYVCTAANTWKRVAIATW